MIKGGFRQINGRQVWFSDYSRQDEETLLKTIKDTTDFYMDQVKDMPENSVPVMIDMAGIKASKKVVNYLKETAEMCKKYNGKTALIGLEPIQYAIVNTVAMFLPFKIKGFENEEQAVAWLFEEDK